MTRVSSNWVTLASLPWPSTSWCSQYRQAVDAVSSPAWMLPSTQNAGLSTSAPVLMLVSTTSQMSRPSKLVPMERNCTRPGLAAT